MADLETYQKKQFFRDDYCGVLLTEMYSVPKGKKGDRQGCFHDASVALRFYKEQNDDGALTEKQYKKIRKAICKDLSVKDTTLKECPIIDPIDPDFSYIDLPEYKWLGKTKSLTTVEDILGEDDEENIEQTEKKEPKPPLGYLYTLKPTDVTLSDNVVEKEMEFIFSHQKQFDMVRIRKFLNKNVWVLSNEKEPQGEPNQLAKTQLGLDIRGVAYIFSLKPLHPSARKRKIADVEKEVTECFSAVKKTCLDKETSSDSSETPSL